jgi:hypothetical protein
MKDLTERVNNLENNKTSDDKREMKEIVESQRVIDEILVANTDAINRINKELLEVEEKIKKQKPDVGESKEDCKKQKSKEVLEKVERRACHGYEYFFSIMKVIFCGLLVKI